jgi:hypothetical protein
VDRAVLIFVAASMTTNIAVDVYASVR